MIQKEGLLTRLALINLMIFGGAALMVHNIYGFVKFAKNIRRHSAFAQKSGIFAVPIALLVMFLLGYLAVGIFGKPDLIVAGILCGGSIFVFIIYVLLSTFTQRLLESEKLASRLTVAEEVNRAKASFFARVSHEMRTPLNAIIGLNGIALRDETLKPETRDRLEKLALSAEHLHGMVDNVLDLNRLESGSLELQEAEFDLGKIISQVEVLAQSSCDMKGLSFTSPAHDALGGFYIGDALQLKRILLAILDNAVKYTDAPGKVSFAAEVVSETEEVRTFRFIVSDTGIGMDTDFVSKLFSTAAQEDESFTTRYDGAGINLMLAGRVLALMGGEIKAESEKGRGSTFEVTIPLRRAARQEAAEPAAAEPVSLAGRRVLVVEDIPLNAEIVQDLLELEGIESEWAENGAVAVEMFEKSAPGHYDAILMDLRMPVLDGFEASRQIRASAHAAAKTIPIIALTANASDSDRQETKNAGMNAHLSKPTDTDLLYEVLREQMK